MGQVYGSMRLRCGVEVSSFVELVLDTCLIHAVLAHLEVHSRIRFSSCITPPHTTCCRASLAVPVHACLASEATLPSPHPQRCSIRRLAHWSTGPEQPPHYRASVRPVSRRSVVLSPLPGKAFARATADAELINLRTTPRSRAIWCSPLKDYPGDCRERRGRRGPSPGRESLRRIYAWLPEA